MAGGTGRHRSVWMDVKRYFRGPVMWIVLAVLAVVVVVPGRRQDHVAALHAHAAAVDGGEAAVAFDGGAEIEMMDSIVGMDATNNNNSGDDIVDLKRSGGGGGNRWPRQETFALLKIRSDMDAVFRDSSLKGPLWEQVSRYVFLYIYVCVYL